MAQVEDGTHLAKSLFMVVAQAPAVVRDYLDICPDSLQFQELVELGALESAILRIYGPNVGFMMSRNAEGEAIATIACLGAEEDEIAFASSLPIAMISAMCQMFRKHFSEPDASPLTSRRVRTH
ncbi:hypothetical protein GRI44_02485 [Altererythrobacter confluentis]|uniref:Uncharacterized protein n=1 Tax=Allopontixanthobacter confluentis TaxID=1849021 RepID=A0A6L7GDF2_9SPHN|nr:hypothetical protein [Allopontixanthobacter confluentis]MXP13620.1 hypothetical protein [Allopontixanthobacter confluentis]